MNNSELNGRTAVVAKQLVQGQSVFGDSEAYKVWVEETVTEDGHVERVGETKSLRRENLESIVNGEKSVAFMRRRSAITSARQ